MGALPGSVNPLAKALEEELAALVSPDVVVRIVTEALRGAAMADMPSDGLMLAAFVDTHLRPALAAVIGEDAADDAARRLIHLARRSTAAPRPATTPRTAASVPLARVTIPSVSRVTRSDAPRPAVEVSAAPHARSGPAARGVKLTPRPRTRALSGAAEHTPPPFRPSGDMPMDGRSAQVPTHKPMPALSSFVVVVTDDERTGEALTGALSELSVHAFIRGAKAIPPAGDVPSVVVLDARDRPVDEAVLARLLWRMGTKVVVWGDDEALRQMRRGYGRADHLVRCHAEVTGRELAHVCQMLLG